MTVEEETWDSVLLVKKVPDFVIQNENGIEVSKLARRRNYNCMITFGDGVKLLEKDALGSYFSFSFPICPKYRYSRQIENMDTNG